MTESIYRSKLYSCEQIDQRLLQGYYDDFVETTGYSGTIDDFWNDVLTSINVSKDKVYTTLPNSVGVHNFPRWSSNYEYQKGHVIVHEYLLFQALTDHTSGNDFPEDNSLWEEVSISELIISLTGLVENFSISLENERKERTDQDALLQKYIKNLETSLDNLGASDVGAVPVVNGKIPDSYMPSWVDDMVDFHGIDDNFMGSFAASGNTLEQPTAVIHITGTFYAIGTDGLAYDNWESYGDIKASEFYGTYDGANGVIPISGKMYFDTTTNKIYRWNGTQLVPIDIGGNLALGETAETAYPGNKGKEVYDAVFAEQKSVPTPAIKISWTFQNNAGNTVEGINESTDSTNPVLERGYKATYSASYSWTNSNSAKYKNPIAASGSWTTLTLDGADSKMISDTITAASTNKSVNITLSAPKTGLMISGSKVIPATGNDTASASKSVTFLPRIYYGWSDAIPTGDTAADTIKKLLNKLQNEATFNSPASKPDGTQYYVFAYPKEWGTINKILMDNADPVTTTFSNNNEVKIANVAGVEHTYYVSVTAAPQKEENFNANVSFSFYFN